MLKLAGETGTGREKIELLTYNPGVQNTGDLEASTKTITATSEASGVGNADYNSALTLPIPTDTRLVIKRIGARLAVTIDSFDTATHLYCRVYVDVQDADHRLFDMDWDSTGAKVSGIEKVNGTIFNLLSDGNSHTFYFFFWIDQANNAVISLVQLWEGVGGCHTQEDRIALLLNFTGLVTTTYFVARVGSGNAMGTLLWSDATADYRKQVYKGLHIGLTDYYPPPTLLVYDKLGLYTYSSVATDLSYLIEANYVLRSEL